MTSFERFFRLFFMLIIELLLSKRNHAFQLSIDRHTPNSRPVKMILFMSYLDSLSKKRSDDDSEKQNNLNPRQSDALKSSRNADENTTSTTPSSAVKNDYPKQRISNAQLDLSKPSDRVFASFRVGDKVRVISGGYSGNVGYVVSVYPDMVKVELSQTRTFLFEIQQLLNLDRGLRESQIYQPNIILENKETRQRPNSSNVPVREIDEQHIPLSNDQTAQIMKQMKFWKVPSLNPDNSKVETIYRRFSCNNLQFALEAINAIGLLADREGHFPDLHISSFREVEVVLHNEKVGGITMKDIQFAKMIDEELDNVQ